MRVGLPAVGLFVGLRVVGLEVVVGRGVGVLDVGRGVGALLVGMRVGLLVGLIVGLTVVGAGESDGYTRHEESCEKNHNCTNLMKNTVIGVLHRKFQMFWFRQDQTSPQ